jgi:Zn-dependent protease with chaperone function
MHLSLILIILGIAWGVRFYNGGAAIDWADRWRLTLGKFLLPPLLLLTTTLAVLCMGTQGQMLGRSVGWIGYSLAIGFLAAACMSAVWLAIQGWRSIQQIQTFPQIQTNRGAARVLSTSTLFAGQVGFWEPELVVSQGLLSRLNPAQLDAVLTHEQAHHYYRDTFWFFWLGWVRHLTPWLPQTRFLWQELLLLRELRADRWAAQSVEPLLLAESLLLVVQLPLTNTESYCAAFGSAEPLDRLTERIEALLAPPPQLSRTASPWWLLLSLLPLLTLAFHT